MYVGDVITVLKAFNEFTLGVGMDEFMKFYCESFECPPERRRYIEAKYEIFKLDRMKWFCSLDDANQLKFCTFLQFRLGE